MSIQDPKGTNGRVFGGDCDLIHIADGQRARHGKEAADFIDRNMRLEAFANGTRTKEQAETQDLCPGCYSVVIFNAALELARRSGFNTKLLARTLEGAFRQLAECDGDAECIESILMRMDTIGERAGVAQPAKPIADLVREAA